MVQIVSYTLNITSSCGDTFVHLRLLLDTSCPTRPTELKCGNADNGVLRDTACPKLVVSVWVVLRLLYAMARKKRSAALRDDDP